MDDNQKKKGLESQLFEDIPREELNAIFQAAKHRIEPADTIIFSQGDPGDSYYFIYSGKARIFRITDTGEKVEMAMLGPGDGVGEMSLLTGERRSAYFQTVEPTHLLVLSKNEFDSVFVKYPNITKVFVKKMSEKLLIEREAKSRLRPSRSSWIDYFLVFSLSLLCGIIFNQVNPNGISLLQKNISSETVSIVEPSTVEAKYREGKAIFIDARPPTFFEQGHIQGAVNIPLAIFDIMYMMEFSDMDKNREIIIYGRTISRRYDQQIANKLVLRGHKNVMILRGGLSEWKRKGLPISSRGPEGEIKSLKSVGLRSLFYSGGSNPYQLVPSPGSQDLSPFRGQG